MKYLEGLNKVIEAIGKLELDQNTQQTAYLGLITVQLATIADELARMNGSVKSNNEAHCASTDEEIVKPYLEKLMIEVGNLEINKPMMSGYGFKQKSPQEIKDEVMKLIDNLLSEQELKNEL